MHGPIRRIWTSEGLDPFDLFLFLFADHPVATVIGLATATWAYFYLSERVPLLGISTGRAGAGTVDSELPNKREAALAQIVQSDPAFDEAKFIERAISAFAAVDDGWNRSDLSGARPFVSDGVYERFRRQLAERKERGVRARISELKLGGTEVLGYVAGPHFDAAYVSFTGSVDDELVAAEGERVVSGGREDFIEVWTYLRRPGAKTLARSGPLDGCCPSCGAELKIVDAAQCPACSAWISSGEYDWVLTEVTRFAAWAFPDPDREVGGWSDLRVADPGLSQEVLEDRAAAVFWRWLDARRRADPAPLSGVSSERFLKALTFDAAFEREAVVAGVETTACQSLADVDRVHVQVSWDADQMRRREEGEAEFLGRESRTFFFIFERKRGVLSDPKAGLRTARCPACGAAPEQADAASCPYCGHAFNDGSLTWVLAEVVPFGRWRRPDF